MRRIDGVGGSGGGVEVDGELGMVSAKESPGSQCDISDHGRSC